MTYQPRRLRLSSEIQQDRARVHELWQHEAGRTKGMVDSAGSHEQSRTILRAFHSTHPSVAAFV